jgi:3-oxoacyl-[acyl-carrier-protein] synthase-1
MMTSVGHDAVTSCAAIRAGITRPSELPDPDFLDDELEPVSITGHPIAGYTDGFYLLARWLRIASGCLLDLVLNARLPDRFETSFWQRSGVIAVTPIIDRRFEAPEPPPDSAVKEHYLSRLLQLVDLPVPGNNLDVVCRGSAGVMEAIVRAQRLLESSALDRVIVLAVDSYLEPMSFNWLKEQGRLKSSENPVGLEPAEAGACFIVESPASSQARGGKIEAVLDGVSIAFEEQNFFSDTPSTGIALHRILNSVLVESGAELPFCGDFVTDLNGENWKATELAYARLRLKDKISPAMRLVLPCESTGDTGSAAAAVSVCVAARSLVRGYSSGTRVLVATSTDHGYVGATCLSHCRL